jgi:hypothetical protein
MEPPAERDLAYYEAIPYLLVLETVERGGQWRRRAEYPELPGCAVEAETALEAIAALEAKRVDVLRGLWTRGEVIPIPRAPLLAGRRQATMAGDPAAPNR